MRECTNSEDGGKTNVKVKEEAAEEEEEEQIARVLKKR